MTDSLDILQRKIEIFSKCVVSPPFCHHLVDKICDPHHLMSLVDYPSSKKVNIYLDSCQLVSLFVFCQFVLLIILSWQKYFTCTSVSLSVYLFLCLFVCKFVLLIILLWQKVNIYLNFCQLVCLQPFCLLLTLHQPSCNTWNTTKPFWLKKSLKDFKSNQTWNSHHWEIAE